MARYVDGYPSLAALVASDRDGSTAIFKRFNRLAARNLLVLQSELVELQMKLDKFDADDQDSDLTMQSLRNWEDYKARARDDPSRMNLFCEIKDKMREYSERGSTLRAYLFSIADRFHRDRRSIARRKSIGSNTLTPEDNDKGIQIRFLPRQAGELWVIPNTWWE
jgi:hypothetical protein